MVPITKLTGKITFLKSPVQQLRAENEVNCGCGVGVRVGVLVGVGVGVTAGITSKVQIDA